MMQRRWGWMVFVGMLLVGVVLSGCNADGDGMTVVSEEPIRLGGTLPLTGPYADTAQWIEQGYRYWAEEINEQGGLLGRPVEIIIQDDGGDPQVAASLLEELIVDEEVDLVLGGYPGTAAVPQMAVAERYRMVYVSMGGHMTSFEQGFTFSFGGPPLMGQWWYEGFWQWLETLPAADRPRRAAMISVNNVIGLSVRESVYDGAARLGMEVVLDDLYDLPLESAEEFVAAAQAADADLFLANGFLADGVLTLQTMKALDYNPDFILQGIGSLVPVWEAQLGADGYYVFSGTPINARLPFAGIEQLNAVAKDRFDLDEAPDYFLFGYTWAQTLQRGVEGAESLDQQAIRDYLSGHEINTVGGVYSFDERGLPAPYSYLTQVQPDGIALIWPLDIRTAEPIYPKPDWTD